MSKTALITGGGSGLGQALAWRLAEQNFFVYIIGRHVKKLIHTQKRFSDRIHAIAADVSTPQGRLRIERVLQAQRSQLDFLIHNAAVVTPIKPLETMTLRAFRYTQATNLEGPLFLTQCLLPRLNKRARILHVSSDCAHAGMAHWVPYCVSKAGLFMAYQCLKKEFSKKNIAIGSLDPGMMDTPMQRYISSEKINFPEKFPLKTLKKRGLLLNPDDSARFCVHILLKTSAKLFSHQEWNAYHYLNS